MQEPPLPADPRPVLRDGAVVGSTCTRCGHHAASRTRRCARCLGDVVDATFGPGGTVWSSATLHLRIGDRRPPFVLAYVDLDAVRSPPGPRILATVRASTELPAGAAVMLVGEDDGDLVVEAAHG